MGLITAPVLYNDSDLPHRRAYLQKMGDWAEAAKEESLESLNQSIEMPRVQEYMKFLQGEWWDRRRPRYLSPFFDNKLQFARYSKLAMLTDIKPIIEVASNVPEYGDQAKLANAIIKHEWFNNNLDMELVTVADAAYLFGNGFWKIGAAMPGYTKITSCGPDMVMPIQPGFHIQDSTAIRYRSYKPLHYFQKIWPMKCDGLEQEAVEIETHAQSDTYTKPFGVDQVTWQAMSPQFRRKIGQRNPGHGATMDRYPVIELNEFWVEDQNINESNKEITVKDPYLSDSEHNYHYKVPPMGRLYPRKRLIVFAGRRLMYDGPSPYWHGLFPFAMLRMNPVMWSFWGLSIYRNLIQINKAINEIVAGTMDAVKRALNPQMITKEGGVPKAAWDVFFANMPGGKLRMGPTANPKADLVYMDPPIMPAYVFQTLTGYLIPEFDRMSGMLDMGKLAGKKQAPGGETIESMREGMNTMTRLEGRHVEMFLRDAGQIALSNIFQFYTAKQRMNILGEGGLTWEDFDYDPENMVPSGSPKEDHHKHFSFEIAQGSLLNNSKDRDRSVAISMAMKDLISRQELYRKLDIPNGPVILEEMKKELDMGLGKGQGRSPRETRGQRNGKPV